MYTKGGPLALTWKLTRHKLQSQTQLISATNIFAHQGTIASREDFAGANLPRACGKRDFGRLALRYDPAATTVEQRSLTASHSDPSLLPKVTVCQPSPRPHRSVPPFLGPVAGQSHLEVYRHRFVAAE
jgi:hypothetical protein